MTTNTFNNQGENQMTHFAQRLAGAATLIGTLLGGTAALAQADGATVAFLMPDQASTRYEEHDYPGFQAAMTELCPTCTVVYQNANADVALQQQQFNAVISQGATVIVLDPVDSTAAASLVEQAHSQGVKVIAYDRPIPDNPADFYVSFDNQGIGAAIAQSLVDHLKAEGVPEGSGVLQINGSPTDAAAGLIRDGIDSALDASGYETLAEFDTPDWAPPEAQQWASGHDATIAALQLIIAGDQYNTISKPSEIVARAAAEVAVQLLNGETPEASTTLYDTPSELFVPAVITAENIKAEIFDAGITPVADVCTADYAEACAAMGITE
jgi:D-xylose transport system substrate-binding protein